MNSVISWLSAWVSTGFGVGYLPAPGTCGTLLIGLPAVFLLRSAMPYYSYATYQSMLISASLILLINVIAIGVIQCALAYFQHFYSAHDPQVIILDEVVGLLWVFIGIPLAPSSVTLGFFLFRIFDITKWGLIGWGEHLPGALGIVADDALAGIAARLVLQAIMYIMRVYF